jgi:glutamine phosphoribosylpyrophosphate amidotransferase
LYSFACRRKNVRKKLNAMALEFAGKNVLLVDGEQSRVAILDILG